MKLPFAPGGIAIGNGSVFVTEEGRPRASRGSARARGRSPDRWTVETRGVRSSDPTGIAVGAGSVWLARGAEVVRVDADTGRVQHRFPLPVTATLLRSPTATLWAASSENGLVEKIDPAVNRIVARGDAARLDHGADRGRRLGLGDRGPRRRASSASTRTTRASRTRRAPPAAAREPRGRARARSGSRARASARSPASTRARAPAHDHRAHRVAGARALPRRRALDRGGAEPALPAAASGPQVRVAVTDEDLPLDPASGVFPTTSQLLYATCMKLVNYPDAAGAAGQRLRARRRRRAPHALGGRADLHLPHPRRTALLAAVRARRSRARRSSRRSSARCRPSWDPTRRACAALSTSSAPAPSIAARQGRCAASSPAARSSRSRRPGRPATCASRLAMPIFCAVPASTPGARPHQRPDPVGGSVLRALAARATAWSSTAIPTTAARARERRRASST